MRIIALTGGVAMGKSTVARMLKALGAEVIDADEIAKNLTRRQAVIRQMVKLFGPDILGADGLDRKKLAQMVFGDDQKRKQLEDLLHPLIYKKMRETLKKLEKQGVQAVVLDIPLLFESGYDINADEIWVVDCPLELQLKRAKERSGWTYSQTLARIVKQMPSEEKRKRAHVVIETGGDMAQTFEQVCKAYEG